MAGYANVSESFGTEETNKGNGNMVLFSFCFDADEILHISQVINKVTTTMGVLGRFTKGVKDASAATGDLLKAATGLSLDNGGHKKSGSSFLSSGGSASKLPPLTPIKVN